MGRGDDRFEFVRTKWSHKWATQAVAHDPDFLEATPVVRIPALVTPDLILTDSHSICDYINGELGGFRLLDTQFVTSHLAQFGAHEIPRDEYKSLLADTVDLPATWLIYPDPVALLQEFNHLAGRDAKP